VRKYYLAYNGKRVDVPLSREEAILLLFTTRGKVKGLSVQVYKNGRMIKQIPKKPR